MDTTNYISLPLLFKSQGWVEAGPTCFRQHDFNKSPPFIFPIPCFCLTWCLSTGPAYHTVRKPVRQTPNEDEYPNGPKKCASVLHLLCDSCARFFQQYTSTAYTLNKRYTYIYTYISYCDGGALSKSRYITLRNEEPDN